jgi:hypothetical protein
MSQTIGTSREQLRTQRMQLFDHVYVQLPLQEQVSVDSAIDDWAERLPRFGPAMGKELLMAIALLVAETCEAVEQARAASSPGGQR